ncbi:MAG TPA: CBS domain-containing protein, partial [Azospirillum sp.]
MDANALTRLDSFPYQHRLAEVMTRPALCVPGTLTLGEAARRMDARGISSLLVEGDGPGRAAGIVTERDV